jgi:hypothetical protein
MSRKTHIKIPSVEGELGYPSDLIDQYKQGSGDTQSPSRHDPSRGSSPRGGSGHQLVEFRLVRIAREFVVKVRGRLARP